MSVRQRLIVLLEAFCIADAEAAASRQRLLGRVKRLVRRLEPSPNKGVSDRRSQGIGGSNGQPPRRRHQNGDETQADMAIDILADCGPLRVREIAAEMIRRGYAASGGSDRDKAVHLSRNLYRVLGRVKDRIRKRDRAFEITDEEKVRRKAQRPTTVATSSTEQVSVQSAKLTDLGVDH